MLNLMNFIQLLDETSEGIAACHGLDFVVKIIKNGVFPVFQIGIPIILIVFGTLDLGKAVIASDDKAVKEAQSKLIKRCIYAIAVFFIVTIISLAFNLVANVVDSSTSNALTEWSTCWSSV